MDIESGKIDMETLKGERVGGVRDEKLRNGYNVHYSGDGYTKSQNFTTMQYIHVTKLHLYPLNLFILSLSSQILIVPKACTVFMMWPALH